MVVQQSLACQSRRPHSHPNQHTEAELKLIRDMRRRNPNAGHDRAVAPSAPAWLHPPPGEPVPGDAKAGDCFRRKAKRDRYTSPKPYEQMTYPGQRVQVDVKVVPTSAVSPTRSCAYSSTPPLMNLPVCASWPPTRSSLPIPPLISSKN